MRDWITNLLKLIDHNRNTAMSLLVVAGIIALAAGMTACESQTASLVDGGNVSRQVFEAQAKKIATGIEAQKAALVSQIDQLNKDIILHNELVEAGRADLDQQDAFKAELLTTIGGVAATAASGGGFNAVALIPTIIGLAGAGLGVGRHLDARRKDAVIEQLKNTT